MSQTVEQLIDECIHLLIASTGRLVDSPDVVLITSTNNYVFKLNKQDEDGYYNITHNDSVIGGLKQDDDRITGKISLSDISSFNTCIVHQLSHHKNIFLLQPMSSKQKYDPKKTNFITKEEFRNEENNSDS